MNNNAARAAVGYFLISGLAALAISGYQFSSPSDPHSQVLLGLSARRLAMALAFLLAAAMPMALAWVSWRRPAMVAGWIRSRLSRDGWLRISVFFCSASAFLVALAVVCFPNWLPVSPVAFFHLQPAFVWVMIVATLNMFSIIGLHKANDARQPPPAIETDPARASTSFQREFVVGCLVILFCTSALLIVNLLIGLVVKDRLNTEVVMLLRAPLRGFFSPEQVERTRYIASALLFPILAFLSWTLASKLQRSVPRSTNTLGAVTFLGVTAGLGSWLFYALRGVDFLYLRFLYPDLHLGPVIGLYAAFIMLVLLERRFSSRTWLKWVLRVGTILIGVLAGLMVASGSLLTSADEYVYTGHFNAYFYSIVQVLLGKTLLVDLTNQYGFYPYFLQHVLHPIGLGVPQLTLVLGVLLVGFFLIVLFLLTRLVKSRLVAFCGFISIACLWLSGRYGSLSEPYFQYWPHRVVFPGILLLLVFLYQKSEGKRRQVAYALAFLACGVGLLWNFDTGAITFAAWVLYLYWETLVSSRALGARRSAIVVLLHSIKAFGTLLAALGLLLLYTYVRSGSIPNLRELAFYQSVFYGSGFFMIPMWLFHPWNLVVLTYMVGLCVCAGFLLKRLRGTKVPEHTEDLSWVNIVFLVSILGVGLFTVYQGRSHNHNLSSAFWSAFFLLALFADALMDRFVGNATAVDPPRVRVHNLATVSLPLFLLFILFAYVSAFFGLVPPSLRGLQAHLGVIRDMAQGVPNPYTHRLEFMRQHFAPGEEVPIFSTSYDTIFYIETRTTNPVHAPGWNELFLQSDVSQYEDYLARNEPRMFLVSDEFAGAFPDLYLTIREDYVEVGRVEDLALFERRLPAR